MSLFSKKNPIKEKIKKEGNTVEKKTEENLVTTRNTQKAEISRDFSSVLLNPHITEKATESAEINQYIFEIDPRYNKKQVRKAILEMYGVTPIKVNITKIPTKKVFLKGKKGIKPGGKKAIVHLKKGDSIEII